MFLWRTNENYPSVTDHKIAFLSVFLSFGKRSMFKFRIETVDRIRFRSSFRSIAIELNMTHDRQSDMSRDMTKPTKWLRVQRRLRSAWASAQSDRSLRCPHEESLVPYLPIERTAKTLIRLGGCSS